MLTYLPPKVWSGADWVPWRRSIYWGHDWKRLRGLGLRPGREEDRQKEQRRLVRRNGIFCVLCSADIARSEPEFRLVFMAFALFACGIGMFLFGYTMSVGSPSPLCAFFQGVMMVGVLIGIFSTLAYALDAFRSQSNEIFIMNMLFKVRSPFASSHCKVTQLTIRFQNFMFYGLSNFANNWVAAKGPTQIMYVFGGTSILLCLMAIPTYIYGKRMRSWWARHDLFVTLRMQTTGPVMEAG